MIEKDRKVVEAAKMLQYDENVPMRELILIIERLDKQLTDQNNKLQMVDDLLADAITEAGMQEEYARQLKKQLAEVEG
jgi:hypothetical protein